MKRKLNSLEKAELQRLENHKNGVIYQMMGACDEINEQIKEVKNGSWYARLQAYVKEDTDK